MINFGINLIVVLIFALINGVHIGWDAVFAIPLFFELFIMAWGVALLLATLYVKFRDIGQIWEVFLQAGMYATPIIYPLTFITNQGANGVLAGKIIMLNPLAQMIQDLRYLLIDKANLTIWNLINHWWYYSIPYFAIGLTVFNRSSKRFAEIL